MLFSLNRSIPLAVVTLNRDGCYDRDNRDRRSKRTSKNCRTCREWSSEQPQPGRSNVMVMMTVLLVCLNMAAIPGIGQTVAADNADQLRRINKMERYLFAESRDGDQEQRLKDIEYALLGKPTAQTAERKIDALYTLLFRGTDKLPSLDMKLNYLEWAVFDATQEGPMSERIARLDNQISGYFSEEPLAFRVDQLLHLTVEGGVISLHRVKLPKGTSIALKLQKELSTKTSQPKEEVPFSVVNDLFLEQNILVIGKGGLSTGHLENIQRGGRFGRSGYLKLAIPEIEAIDATPIPVKILGIGDEDGNRKKMGMAVGASAVGYLLMGPVGLVGGAFVKGRDVDIDPGTVVMVSTAVDCYVSGIVIHRKN